jgi:ADP-heptose:LPS heptosyltransferase
VDAPAGLPPRFAAVKFYMGAAIPDSPDRRRALRGIVARLAASMPVVALDTGLTLDEHRDFLFDGIDNVLPIAAAMTPATNLAVQTQVIGRASLFVGTCGSLAWLAPMMGTPAIGVYADDRFLAPHLFVARQAYKAMNGASFATLDLSALDALDLVPDPAAAARPMI